jgi:hypothetical protein
MNQDWYFQKIQMEGAIRSSRRQIERARQMLHLTREHIDLSQANLSQAADLIDYALPSR